MAGIHQILGENIKILRKEHEWSRNFLADKLDISVSFLTMVELGQRGVSLALVEDIASVFRVPIPYLFTEKNINKNDERIKPEQMKALESELKNCINERITEFFETKWKENS